MVNAFDISFDECVVCGSIPPLETGFCATCTDEVSTLEGAKRVSILLQHDKDPRSRYALLLARRERQRVKLRARLDAMRAAMPARADKLIVGWCSKARSATRNENSTAHWVDEDGTTACAKMMVNAKGTGPVPRLAPFTCSWEPHVADRDHCCRYCVGLRDRAKRCTCGMCRPGQR